MKIELKTERSSIYWDVDLLQTNGKEANKKEHQEAFGSATILKNSVYHTKCGHWVKISSAANTYDKQDMQEPKDEYCFGCRVTMGMK
jgi:hypothetical protein